MNYFGGYYKLENGKLLEVQECDDGYDFSVYDAEVNLLDGGVLESDEWLEECFVVKEVLTLLDIEECEYETIDSFWM